MTPFRFRLQRVLAFSRTKYQVAESECRQAEGRLRAVQAQQAALVAKKSETRDSVARLPTVAGSTLESLTGWFHWTETEVNRLKKVEQSLAMDLRKRRAVLVEAHRKVRLLEKLHDHRHAEWQQEFDREVEAIAADAITSRYAREL